jgi:hypothetical protein
MSSIKLFKRQEIIHLSIEMRGLCFTCEFTFGGFSFCNSHVTESKAQTMPIRNGLNTFHLLRLEI